MSPYRWDDSHEIYTWQILHTKITVELIRSHNNSHTVDRDWSFNLGEESTLKSKGIPTTVVDITGKGGGNTG